MAVLLLYYFVVARSGQAMPSSASAAFRSKYGKYLPHQRFNVDQVPLRSTRTMVREMDGCCSHVRVWGWVR